MEKLSILAKLELTEEEERIAKQDLEQMIAFVDVLKELDTDSAVLETEELIENVFREDVVENEDCRDEILMNAPEKQEGCFVVPCTIGGREA